MKGITDRGITKFNLHYIRYKGSDLKFSFPVTPDKINRSSDYQREIDVKSLFLTLPLIELLIDYSFPIHIFVYIVTL